MEFKVLPDITSQSGFTYEVSRDGVISHNGISNILKIQRRGNREQVRVD